MTMFKYYTQDLCRFEQALKYSREVSESKRIDIEHLSSN